MKRVFSLLLLAALVPISVRAQGGPPIQRFGGPTTPAGLTVNENEPFRVPATRAVVNLQLQSVSNGLTITAESLKPLTDALARAGADPTSIHYSPNVAGPGATNVASVTAAIEHPTVEMVKSGMVTVATAIAQIHDLRLTGANVSLLAASCSEAIDAARQRAIDRARAKAAKLASEAHVSLGRLTYLNSFDSSQNGGTCSSGYGVGPNGPQFGFFNDTDASYDSNYVTVMGSAGVTLVYEIK